MPTASRTPYQRGASGPRWKMNGSDGLGIEASSTPRRYRHRPTRRAGRADDSGGASGLRQSHPATLGEPPPHRANAGNSGVIRGMPLAQPQDGRQHALTAREARLGVQPKPRPRIRPWPLPRRGTAERTHRVDVVLERARPRTREAPVRTPGAHERHGKIASGVRSHECHRVMPLAQPDPHAVSELPLERPAARTVKADRADRHLHRHAAGLVERGQTSHARERAMAGSHATVTPWLWCVPIAQLALAASVIWRTPAADRSAQARSLQALCPPTSLIFRSFRSTVSAN